jgi:hypothetical protein
MPRAASQSKPGADPGGPCMTKAINHTEALALLTAASPTRRTFMIAAAFVLITMPALAADASAKTFVTGIYDAYKGSGAKGLPLDSENAVRRYFEPSLATLIIKDRRSAARRREVGKLDGDPFIDAQDWNIDKFDVEIADTGPGKAKATVKFVNLDQPAMVVLDLVKNGKDWRIAEITWLHDGKPETLRALYTH